MARITTLETDKGFPSRKPWERYSYIRSWLKTHLFFSKLKKPSPHYFKDNMSFQDNARVEAEITAKEALLTKYEERQAQKLKEQEMLRLQEEERRKKEQVEKDKKREEIAKQEELRQQQKRREQEMLQNLERERIRLAEQKRLRGRR